jgi:hypothetical protein
MLKNELETHINRIFLDSLYDYDHTAKMKLLNSIYLGVDKLVEENGFFQQILQYINVRKIMKFHQD